jgi:replicative DNA helicase
MSRTEMQARYLEQEGLPTNIEAERAVLGAILLDNSAFNQAASRLQADDFALDSHRRIYLRMAELIETGSKIDFVTTAERLIRHHELEAVGGAAYLTSLTDGLPRVKNISQYVDIVREKSRARMLLNTFESGAARIREREPADEVLAEAQNQLIEIIHHGRAGKTPGIGEIAQEAYTELMAIRQIDGRCVGLSTGLDELDALTTGFRNSEFYVIGARPGQGKTAIACQAIRRNCKEGRKCALFSIEVKRTQIMNRLAAMESKISVFEMRDTRGLSEDEMNRIALAMNDIGRWPLMIEDSPRLDVKEMAAIARLFISQGAEIIFVDYLQKLRAPGKTDFERVTATADALWELARSTDVPVVALSQLRRSSTPNEPPTMDDLRQSGQIEQNANGVFLLYRPLEVAPETKKRRFTGEDQVIIGKQRSGPAETHVPVVFDGGMGLFRPRTSGDLVIG